jgi:hypothetical protein
VVCCAGSGSCFVSEIGADVENTYRRGYAQGAVDVISGIVHLLSDDQKQQVEDWYLHQLTPWRGQQGFASSPPPDFPRI